MESAKMNRMVRELQPDIIMNNRAKIPEDFDTPEQNLNASVEGRAWESCMTMNGSWGYQQPTMIGKRPRPLCATSSLALAMAATTC